MNIPSHVSRWQTRGSTLLATLAVTIVALALMGMTLQRTMSVCTLNARSNQYSTGMYAAEAATEKVIAQMKVDYPQGADLLLSNQLKNGVYQGMYPTTSEDPYWGQFSFTDGSNHVGTSVYCVDSRGWGSIQGQYVGLQGWTNTYRVLSNVRMTSGRYNITNSVQQDVECDAIPVFQFAIFYNSLLEFTWCATMTVNGRVHANGSIFVGSIDDLTFNNLVTSTCWIGKTNWAGYTTSQYTGAVNYNATYSTNATALVLPIGVSNTPSAVREIINMPPPGGDTNQTLASQRYYNNAEIVLLVTNGLGTNNMVTVLLRNSTNDPGWSGTYTNNGTNYAMITTNLPFLNLTNSFMDQREGKTVNATQIDMGVLSKWLLTNSDVVNKFGSNVTYGSTPGLAPNIMYVADNRSNSSSSVLYAVRLTNGLVIPSNNVSSGPTGFTVCTPNPLYVWGNYNCPNTTNLNTTNTSSTYPAALVSDALTILSPNWKDSQSSLLVTDSSKNDATSTTVNAAILTGVVYSTGNSITTFSGGVHNLPRLLEDWRNVTLTINTSIVNLFNSMRATTQWKSPGNYYYAPTRQFSFDPNFMSSTKQPPGTPQFHVILRKAWSTARPDTLTTNISS